MKNEEKKKLEEILGNLESIHSIQGDDWKSVIENNREEFERIKFEIKEKQKELNALVTKKRAITISDEEFNNKTQKIQKELYDLERKIYNLRLKAQTK